MGYVGCLDPASNQTLLLQWVKKMELIQLQQGRTIGTLEAVKTAVVRCMAGWKRVWFDINQDDLLAETEDGHQQLPFRMLSDGVRNMLAMVADIAYRAAVLNPHLGERAAEQTPGIVLIDEIDLHLHPKWQRRVVDDLRTTFPQVQFVATTHSPFIIQSLRPGELINLEEEAPSEPPSQSIEDIAEQVMGVEVPQRSERYQQMMEAAEEYYRVLQEAKATTSPEQREALKRRLDALSEPFSDNVAYHAFLRMEREAAGLGEEP
jgi:predicted ATP-binding protein involved in virulence